MKILNIHGYKGNSANSAYSALHELGYKTISPAILKLMKYSAFWKISFLNRNLMQLSEQVLEDFLQQFFRQNTVSLQYL